MNILIGVLILGFIVFVVYSWLDGIKEIRRLETEK